MVLDFGIKDLIDILIVGTMMFWVFRVLRRTGATNMFWAILMIVVLWFFVSVVFNLELTGAIFNYILSIGAIALVVIFQEELRNLLYRFGSRFTWKSFGRKSEAKADEEMHTQLTTACRHMAATKTGALIVISGSINLKEYEDSGEYLNATISSRLLENIFFKNTPLHDGAVIIDNHQVVAAACILPVSKNTELPAHYGLRHRAALGITERTDATAIVVSEETGRISVAKGNTIKEVTADKLFEDAV